MKKVVIIGGVAGGASCAARLRRLDETAEIIILERGPYISYANCGLPYHVGDVIKSRNALLLQTPEVMRARFQVDVRVQNEVLAIDRAEKKVTVRRIGGETYEESYDTLVIATGSLPVRPRLPGIDCARVQTLWTIADTDRIRDLVQKQGIQTAAVVGGGFIGLEMADNLHHAGVKVSLIEAADQVMAPLDPEMALLLQQNMSENGVQLHLKERAASFAEEGSSVILTLQSGRKVSADLVILAIGVRPNSELAQKAGLKLNERGGIVVDKQLQTSDPHIYAVGDVIEVEDFVFRGRTMVPLAGPANKQGRIAADNIAGAAETYEGSQGTSIAKVFDLTAAATGANEKTLRQRGLKKGADYETILIVQNSHAKYYPGAVPLTLKMLFSTYGHKIFGAQIVGRSGVDKRIDTLAAAMRLGAGIQDLQKLELAYAPPYSSAKDPVNMAGYVAANLLAGKVAFTDWDAVEKNPQAVLLDVREAPELKVFSLPGAVHIPMGQLRERLGELDPEKEIIVFCAAGVRAYSVMCLLNQHGFKKVKVYPGGVGFYQGTHGRGAK